jgi:hypothetical protein
MPTLCLLRAFPGAAVAKIKRIKMNAHKNTSLTQSNKETTRNNKLYRMDSKYLFNAAEIID